MIGDALIPNHVRQLQELIVVKGYLPQLLPPLVIACLSPLTYSKFELLLSKKTNISQFVIIERF